MNDVPGEMTIRDLLKVPDDEDAPPSRKQTRMRTYRALHRFMTARGRGYTVRELRQYAVYTQDGRYYFIRNSTRERHPVPGLTRKNFGALQGRLAALCIGKMKVLTGITEEAK